MTATSRVTDIEPPFPLEVDLPRGALIDETQAHLGAVQRFHDQAVSTINESERKSAYRKALGRACVAGELVERISPLDVDTAFEVGIERARLITDAKHNYFYPTAPQSSPERTTSRSSTD